MPQRHSKALALIVVLLLVLTGCSYKITASFDIGTQEAILKCARLVDKFYSELFEVPESERAYQKFASSYIELEVELKSLIFRNEARPLNKESTKQAQNVLLEWQKYKKRHKDKGKYTDGNAKLDYKRLKRMLKYALKAEKVKKGEGAVNK